jgi:hypothetical protein
MQPTALLIRLPVGQYWMGQVALKAGMDRKHQSDLQLHPIVFTYLAIPGAML